jgi:hypothetical protein
MARTSAVDGFALAYFDTGTPPGGDPGRTAVLLHGWPGDSHDYRHVVPLLRDTVRVIVRIGPFTPLEAPAEFAGVVQLALAARIG